MKKLLWILILSILGAVVFGLGFYFQDITLLFNPPKILAKVNDMEITDLDLKRELAFLKSSDNSGFSESTREDLLDRMINDLLIVQEAQKLGLTVPEALVNSRLAQAETGYSAEETKKIFKEVGLTPAVWRKLMERQLLIETMVQKLEEESVRVGEDEIDAYYWAHLGEYFRGRRVRARQIVVETEEQAKALKQKIDQGESFETLAQKFSRGPERDMGGDLGWVSEQDLPRAFSQALFALKPGEVSGPVATSYGFHLFKVEEADKGGKIPPEEAKRKIADDLKADKADQAFQAWIGELRGKAKIAIKDVRGGE